MTCTWKRWSICGKLFEEIGLGSEVVVGLGLRVYRVSVVPIILARKSPSSTWRNLKYRNTLNIGPLNFCKILSLKKPFRDLVKGITALKALGPRRFRGAGVNGYIISRRHRLETKAFMLAGM